MPRALSRPRPSGKPATQASDVRRCAIYTRKSSEEGLEQAFNSLDAQREACEAYIRSQRHEGWVALPKLYDDGGLSGGTLERPALQQLLGDIQARRVDLILVYKVDRLTRSLADFAKIVDVFDAHGVSFVSVTQQFNTSTSMGRLTLNMLLSFAQFEREVTGERIRDKIAASKRRGMWMGGTVPLGYDVQDRKLVINNAEADTVRHIFRSYQRLGSVRLLAAQLAAEGIGNKVRTGKLNGHPAPVGHHPMSRGSLYLLLQNRVYRGEVVHKGAVYPGEQPAIVEMDVWAAVQHRLATNRIEQRSRQRARDPSLLAGLVRDAAGDRLVPSHANKGGKRYRYYVSQSLIVGSKQATPGGVRIPAGELEQVVIQRLRAFLASPADVIGAVRGIEPSASHSELQVIAKAALLADALAAMRPLELRALLRTILDRVVVDADRITLHLRPSALQRDLLGQRQPIDHPSDRPDVAPTEQHVVLSISATLRRAGREMALAVDPAGPAAGTDAALVKLVIKAQSMRDRLIAADDISLAAFAACQGLSKSYITRLVRVAYLSPRIVAQILEGQQPPGLTAQTLMLDTRLPLDWSEQEQVLGFR